jgi:hypothetical protein
LIRSALNIAQVQSLSTRDRNFLRRVFSATVWAAPHWPHLHPRLYIVVEPCLANSLPLSRILFSIWHGLHNN